ncbi:SH3 domain-containing protein [Coraliomargarita parva]|uniref:SH3 domain-containing protein n=1 Tax=Coraliomargarita parva TaxID=3014050 RepID=UPI0022B3F0A0|nr:SH3 domain-containing protein [Coraliomargarita parva]
MNILRILSCSCACLWAAGPLRGADMALHLSADEHSPVIATVPEGSPALRQSAPVLERKAAEEGWRWLDYRARVQGHVPSARLSKNFEIDLDTFIRATPSSNAPVLSLVEPGDQFEIVEANDDWTTVRFTKNIPAYYKTSTRISERPALSVAAPAAMPGARKAVAYDPNASLGKTAPEDLAPENVVWSVRKPGSQPLPAASPPIRPETTESDRNLQPIDIVVAPTQTQAIDTPQRPADSVGVPMRRLNGKLVREISSFGPRYPLRLKSARGERIAYVDMSRLFIPNLQPYIDQQVRIHGEVRPLVPGSRELVIVARTIRLAE